MVVKQIRVVVSYPYKIGEFMYGRVELEEVIEIGKEEDSLKIEVTTGEALLANCKEIADSITSAMDYGIKQEEITGQNMQVRKRRF